MAGTPLRIGGIFAALLVLGTLALLAVTPASARAYTTDCANAEKPANEATLDQIRRSITCMVHEVRRRRDRPKIRTERHLRKVAQRHTKVMLAQDCFAHVCSGEGPVGKGIEQSGYLAPGQRYGYGENLGYAKTPLAMMESWLASRFHRRNIVGARFRHLGVGVGNGTPAKSQPDWQFATYTLIFAWRR